VNLKNHENVNPRENAYTVFKCIYICS